MIESVRAHPIEVSDNELTQLVQRLKQTRLPFPETVSGWDQGPPVTWMKHLRDYWIEEYDWRKTEKRLDKDISWLAKIGQEHIHFLHFRSKHANAQPLIATHGWPGSVLEFLDVADKLTDPTNHGGSEDDAFHLVVPSLPGFGFSDCSKTNWTIETTAKAWAELMRKLGYSSYFAQGGDWGSGITTELARIDPQHCKAIHLNSFWIDPVELENFQLTMDEIVKLQTLDNFIKNLNGYADIQDNRPQTIGYSLADSPLGLAAWVIDVFSIGVKHAGTLEDVVSIDKLLDGVMMYWLPNSGATSARFYWNNFSNLSYSKITTPSGFSSFPGEILSVSERMAKTRLKNLLYWNDLTDGGHFPALEVPDLFASELRSFAQTIRAQVPGI